MHSIDISRQRYLDLIHRYLQGRLGYRQFRVLLRFQWAEEREELWPVVWQTVQSQGCQEIELLATGQLPQAFASDPRRLCRMLDRLCNLCLRANKEDLFYTSVEELLSAYYHPETSEGEGQYIAFPPRIPVFERPLPDCGRHRYSCTVSDIRKKLALIPEYDLEGLWAIGLSPPEPGDADADGIYYRWYPPICKPVILLYSWKDDFQFKLLRRNANNSIHKKFLVERRYGLRFERRDTGAYGVWSPEDCRRYQVQHVLLHEIGHHVDYQHRWRNGYRRYLPSRIREQFAEDYAIRMSRQTHP